MRGDVVTGTDRDRTAVRRVRALGSTAAVAAVLSLAGLTPPASAAGVTWYVDQSTGTDAPVCGSSTGANACASIGAALVQAGADDIVSIAAGSYAETLPITTAVTLQGSGAADVVLAGTDATQPTIVVNAAGAVRIADMTIQPAPGASVGQPVIDIEHDRALVLSRAAVNGVPGDPATAVGVLAGVGSTLTVEDSTMSGLFTAIGAGADELTGTNTGPATVSISSSSLDGNGNGVAAFAGTVTIVGGSISENMGNAIVSYGPDVVIDATGTAISGNGGATGGTFSGSVALQAGGTFTGHGVTMDGNRNGVTLEGGDLTLINSSVTNSLDGDGAAILARPGASDAGVLTPTVSLTGTELSGHYAGLIVDSGQTQIISSTIADNRAGIVTHASVEPGRLELVESVVTGNGDGAPGEVPPAGVALEGATEAIVTDSQITDNTFGFISYAGSQATVTGSTISENDWVGLAAFGSGSGATVDVTGTSIMGNGLDVSSELAGPVFGGIVVQEATITGNELTVSGNAAGAIVLGGNLTLTDSTINDNVRTPLDDVIGLPITGRGVLASDLGAATPVSVHLLRTEVAGNDADGVQISGGAGVIELSTIAENGGAGISTEVPGGDVTEAPTGSLLVAGSTVAENAEAALQLGEQLLEVSVIGSIVHSPEAVPACAGEPAALVDTRFNVVSDESCAFDAASVVADPELEPLADNGGPTRTALPSPTGPAMNLVPAGTSVPWADSTIDLCPGDVDQRGTGYPRLTGSGCDAGAVERTSGLITVTAGDATTYEGAFEPEITPSFDGFLGGDTVADLDTLPTCGYDLEAATTFCSGAADDFYSFEYVDGALTVLDPLVIVTDSLPGATVGQEYSVTLEATGGDGGPYTWGIQEGTLPAGLQIDTATGEISGIPETAGPATFTVFVGDPILKEFTITVEAAPVAPTEPPTTSEPSEQPTSAAPAPPAGSDDTGQGLPDTGSNGLAALAVSAAIVLLGCAVLLIARRGRAV